MTIDDYYIGVLEDLKLAITASWGSGEETEKTEICSALQYAIERLKDETKH